jgi:hypothetical protein
MNTARPTVCGGGGSDLSGNQIALGAFGQERCDQLAIEPDPPTNLTYGCDRLFLFAHLVPWRTLRQAVDLDLFELPAGEQPPVLPPLQSKDMPCSSSLVPRRTWRMKN